jgi:PAS domain S-box-containing protein
MNVNPGRKYGFGKKNRQKGLLKPKRYNAGSVSSEGNVTDNQDIFRVLVENQNDLVVKADLNGVLLYVNPSYCKLFGKSKEELIGKKYLPLVHEEDRERTNQTLQLLMFPPHTCHVEQRALTVDGWKWLSWNDSVVFGPDGEIKAIIGVGRDIQARKEAEKLLSEKENLFRGLFNYMPSAAVIYEVINNGESGRDYIFRNMNATGLKIENKEIEEVIGKSLSELRPNIDNYGLIEVFRNVWETGESSFFPSKVYWDENYYNWYENTVFKLPSGEIVAIYNDTTDRQKAEEALQQLVEEKQMLLKELQHRIKNSLNIVVSLIALEIENHKEVMVSDVLARIKDRVLTLSHLYNQLYETNKTQMTRLDSYFESIIDTFRQSYLFRNSWLKVEFHAEAVDVDTKMASSLGLILNELLTNSYKHAFPDRQEGKIDVRISSSDGILTLSIGDNGKGITDLDAFRGSDGIGIKLVEGLVAQHLGEMTIDPGHGLTFHIRVPLR